MIPGVLHVGSTLSLRGVAVGACSSSETSTDELASVCLEEPKIVLQNLCKLEVKPVVEFISSHSFVEAQLTFCTAVSHSGNSTAAQCL